MQTFDCSVWTANEVRRLYDALTAVVKRTDHAVTLDSAVDSFLSAKLSEVGCNELSAGRFDVLARSLRAFRAHPAAAIDAAALTGFAQQLRSDVAAGRLAVSSARCCLSCVRQFVRWCYRHELIEDLPRNLDDLRVGAYAPDVRVMDVERFRTILAAANQHLAIALLLMANCGFTQQDVADLAPHQVDWSIRRIGRKRSKTQRCERVPRVSYALWPETWELLQQLGRRDGERVLVSRSGQPLKRSWINAEGKLSKVDAIGRNYQRLRQRLGIARSPLKLIRKTSASLLDEHPEFGRYVQYFLGHAPRTVADRHYVRPNQERFDAAVAWLATAYGLAQV